MRCHICNNVLTDKEVKFNEAYDEFEPCSECLNEIDEVFEDYPETEDVV